MYSNKQDFVPPLVIYGIVHLTNMEGFLCFLNKAYGQLGYHSANLAAIFRGKDAPKILCGRQYFLLPIFDGLQVHVIDMQHNDLLLHYEQSLVK